MDRPSCLAGTARQHATSATSNGVNRDVASWGPACSSAPVRMAPSDNPARTATTHVLHVGQLLLHLQNTLLLPLERARPLLPDDAEEIMLINDSAIRLNDRLLNLSATCSTITADLQRTSSERKAVLPDEDWWHASPRT